MKAKRTDRRRLVAARNPTCLGCGDLILAVTESVIVGPPSDQRLTHIACFLRAIRRTNPTFSQRVAKARELQFGAHHGHLSS